MPRITINGISIDPQTQVELANLEPSTDESSGYIIIQTSSPLKQIEREALRKAEVEVLEYVPENAYICHFSDGSLETVEKLPFVVWAHPYMEGFKIPAHLHLVSPTRAQTATLSAPALETSMSQKPRQMVIVLHKDAKIEEVRTEIATAARIDPKALEFTQNTARVMVQPQHIEDIARVEAVRHLEEYGEAKLHNNVALQIVRADEAHLQTELEGDGEIIAVCDTGFDRGDREDTHPAFNGRVLKLYPLGRISSNDPHGHGTHVAGSALGDGVSNIMGGSIRGSAPKAQLVLQSVLDHFGGLGGLPNDLDSLFRTPYENDGARIHTNSWGISNELLFGRYTAAAEQVDRFVWENRDIVILFAAGNEGSDRNADGVIDDSSITPPGTAKNCITVGATESQRPDQSKPYGIPWPTDFPTNPLADDFWADNPNGIAAFSSRGPTDNGRIKPDLTAPGTSILSAHSRDAQVGSFWGQSNDALYAFMGGTSMATPIVAGCAAIVRQYYRTRHGLNPTAALVKATLINGATDLIGQYMPSEAAGFPNNTEGFGRIDMVNTVGPHPSGRKIWFWDEHIALDTGDEERFAIDIAEEGAALKATLVWTDPPSEALQNDLDLIIRTADGQERHGNISPQAEEFDRVNNVEQIVWENLPEGRLEIIVHAHRITLFPQSFALVIRSDGAENDENDDMTLDLALEISNFVFSMSGPSDVTAIVSFVLAGGDAATVAQMQTPFQVQLFLDETSSKVSSQQVAVYIGYLENGDFNYEVSELRFPISAGTYKLRCLVHVESGEGLVQTEYESPPFRVVERGQESGRS
jgi:hypothetical protein